MKALVVAAIAMIGLSLGAATAGAKEAPDNDASVPSFGVSSGAEKVAAQLLEAMKQGEAQTFLRLLDLRALYRDTMSSKGGRSTLRGYFAFVKQVRRAAKAEFGDGLDEGFEYRIVGSRRQGDETIVTVEFRPSEDDERQEHAIAFTAKGGEWKITVEGMKSFDFGYGARGPIGRGGDSALEATKDLLKAAKTGDGDVILDRLDLEGMYEATVPEGMRDQMKYEDWERSLREAMKESLQPKPDLQYEIIDAETKGDRATVKVKTKKDDNADWHEAEVLLKKIDGKWKVTMEGIMALGNQD